MSLINLKLLTIANLFLQNIAKHENFSATKYENAVTENISCSAELSIKYSFITTGPDLGFCFPPTESLHTVKYIGV